MNVLIINSVPSNGGDEALLLATIQGIKNKIPNAKFNVLCNDADNVKKHIKYVNIDWDWEYSTKYKNNFLDRLNQLIRKVLNKFKIKVPYYIYNFTKSVDEKRILNYYKNSDYIVSSAGGYIHDIYGYNNRMLAFEIAINYNKKLIFFGQSFGPFYNYLNHNRLINIFKKSYKIILREDLSLKHLEGLADDFDNVSVSTDIAFSLHNNFKSLFIEKEILNKKIVVSFRDWIYKVDNSIIINLGTLIVKFLIKKGYEVTFLSTCQGLNYYKSDVFFGLEINKNLNNLERNKFFVDENKYSVQDLIKQYSKFDAYIGMRLHGAILAMLGGTPAFNIGYEDKSIGIYNFSGLSDYQISFDSDNDLILAKIDDFLLTKEEINLKKIVSNLCNIASANFEIFN